MDFAAVRRDAKPDEGLRFAAAWRSGAGV